jgi:hypothetical protein
MIHTLLALPATIPIKTCNAEKPNTMQGAPCVMSLRTKGLFPHPEDLVSRPLKLNRWDREKRNDKD